MTVMKIPGGSIMLRSLAALLFALILVSDASAYGRYGFGYARYGSFGNYQPGLAGRAARTHFPRTRSAPRRGFTYRVSHPAIPRIYNVGHHRAVFRGGRRH
jgi:hypothetical protein